MLCSPLVLHNKTLRPFVGNATICGLAWRLETDVELMVHEVFHAMGAVRISPVTCPSKLAFSCKQFEVMHVCTMH
jgi:hypothetical protein